VKISHILELFDFGSWGREKYVDALGIISYFHNSNYHVKDLSIDQQMSLYRTIKRVERYAMVSFLFLLFGSLVIYFSFFTNFELFLSDLGDVGRLLSAGIFILLAVICSKVINWIERLYLESVIKDYKIGNLENKIKK